MSCASGSSDPHGGASETDLTITVTDQNEAPTVTDGPTASRSTRTSAIGTAVGSVTAADPDGPGVAFGQLRYYFLNGGTASATSADGRYAIDATTGAITTASALNYEAGTPSAAYTVAVRDNQGAAGYLQDTSTVTIGINNVNEAPNATEGLSFAIAENQPIGTIVGSVTASDPDGAAVFGQMRYFFLDGDAASNISSDGRYAIDAMTGAIRVNSALNFEAGTPSAAYTVAVRDNEGATGYLQDTSTVTIGITNVNEAPVIPGAYGFDVDENQPIGTAVGTVAASDPDGPGVAFGQLRYFFFNGGVASATSADGRYAIDAMTGAITTASTLDYEAGTPSAAYTVVARDNGGAAGYHQVTSTVTIGINNVNEAPTATDGLSFAIAENQPIGTIVGSVTASDPDGAAVFGQLRYFFLNGGSVGSISADGRYAIDAMTGAIRVNSALDYEAGAPSAAYTVAVRDNEGEAGYLQDTTSVTIGIANVNEAPTIPGSYGFDVDENQPIGTMVGTVAASDPDGPGVAFGQLRYFFFNGGVASATSADGRYAIDAATGAITTASALNYEAGTPSAAYTVVARDNGGAAGYNQVSSTVTIGINNVNEAPVATDGLAFAIAENQPIGTIVGSVTASDPDGATIFGQLRYFFFDGGAASNISADGRYAIDAMTGAIRVNSALDYEAGAPSAAYTVAVRDNEGEAGYLQDTTTVTIGITNVNEAPTIPGAYGFDVDENVAIGTMVGTVAASDPDGPGVAFGQLRYFFFNGGVASATSADGRYAIDAVTGAITTNSALNYEAGTPSAAYTVVTRDNAGAAGYLQAASTVTIGINNVNEAPVATDGLAFAIDENEPIGTVVGTVTAGDPDGLGGEFGQLRYFFLDGSSASNMSSDGRYVIDAVTGVISTNSALNYEAAAPSADYTVVVRDREGGAGYLEDTTVVTIGITNVNEAPTIPGSYGFDVDENVAIGTAVGTVAASDPDSPGVAFGQLRYYFLDGSTASATSADGRYAIDAVTGAITTASPLNYEAGTPSAAYTVVTRDNAGAAGYIEAASTVTIGINNVNEAPVATDGLAFAIAENQPIGTIVGSVTASDPDGATIFGQMRYFFLDGGAASNISADGRYAIDAMTGAIRVNSALDYEAGTPSAAYTVAVRDNEGEAGYLQDTTSVTIGITNVNEAPVATDGLSFAIDENQPVGTVVGAVTASDPDDAGLAYGQLRYYFRVGNLQSWTASATSGDGRYAIDAVTGVISVNSALDYEAGAPSLNYTVLVRDNEGEAGYLQDTTTVTIGITNVNEAPTATDGLSFAIDENEPVGTVVGTVTASDPDGLGAEFGQLRYFFLDGSSASNMSSDGRYVIDAVTGVISTSSALNYEAGTPSADYTVVVRDREGGAGSLEDTTVVTIGITNVNEAPTATDGLSFTIDENRPIGTAVGTVPASDPDGTAVFGQLRYAFRTGNPVSGWTTSAISADGRYAIDAVTGVISINSALDYEAGTPSAAYTVVVRDNEGAAGYLEDTTTVTIGINNLNEAPTSVDWAPAISFVAERDRIPYGTGRPSILIGSLSVQDPDASGTAYNNYDLSVVNDERFEIVGESLFLKADAVLDFEAGSTVSVTVRATDQSGNPFTIDRVVTINIGNEDDVLEGDGGNNILTGQQNRDLIYGFEGNDTIDGGAGDDLLEGGAGDDRLLGGLGADSLAGGDGTDILVGGAGNDTLSAGENNGVNADILYGGDGADVLQGGDGTEVLIGGAGADQMVGGAGTDTASYAYLNENQTTNTAVTADLLSSASNTGAAAGDTYSGIENLTGTGGHDQLRGDNAANVLDGLGGSDAIQGRDGDDTIRGGIGSDTLFGDGGNDVMEGGDGGDWMFGGDGNDTMIGGSGDDRLWAESGDDTLIGGAGVDEMYGGENDDTYIVMRSSGVDQIFNFDEFGADILGFQDPVEAINARDLWFERSGDDLLISVLGTTTSVRVVDWYSNSEEIRENFQIDFIGTGDGTVLRVNVEGLVALMAGHSKPATAAAHDILRANDPDYRVDWEIFWTDNERPEMFGISDQVVNEDGTITLTITVTDDSTPAAGIQIDWPQIENEPLIGTIHLGQPNENGERILTITPTQHAAGTASVSLRAIDANGASVIQTFQIDVLPVAQAPTIDLFSDWTGDAGTDIPLNLNITFPDQDGSEVHDVVIEGVPANLSLNRGVQDGRWAIGSSRPETLPVSR